MEKSGKNQPKTNTLLKKMLISYYNWEKGKYDILFQNENNKDKIVPIKNYYLIEKNWMNSFKKIIEYNNLIAKINKEKTNIKNEEEIIEEYINKDLKEKQSLLNKIFNDENETESENEIENENKIKDNDKEREIMREFITNKNFGLEIINKDVIDLLNCYKGIKIPIEGKIKGNKIIFEMNIGEYKIILVIFPIDECYISKMYFILESDDKNYDFLINQIQEKDYENILKEYKINKEDINKGGVSEKIALNPEKNKSIGMIIINKVKINKYIQSNLCKVQTIHVINKKCQIENMKNDIQKFFNCLTFSNSKFNKALTFGEISANYNPCKLISRKWIYDFINLFKYKENSPIIFSENNNKKYKELTQQLPIITQENIDNGEFYIINENCFISLFPLIPGLEDKKEKYLDYKIYLKNNKGLLVINEDIYIFQTKDDINQRNDYEKVKNQIKYEFLYKSIINKNLELTEDIWKKLKTKFDNTENNNNNKLNENKRNSPIMSEEKIKNYLNTLHQKEKELDIMKQGLIKKEKELERKIGEINESRQVEIDKKLPTIGLQNLGATCYMNAVLQCIAHFLEVSEKILTWYKYSKDNNKKSKKLSCAYAEVLNNLYFPKENQNNIITNYKYYAPYDFKELIGNLNPLFKGIQANDSKDIMNYIIEKMHEELNPLGKQNVNNINTNNNNIIIDQTNEFQSLNYFLNEFKNNFHSILTEYLYGIQKTVTLCLNCSTMIYNFQTYNFLIFPLLEVKNYILMNNYQNPFFNMQNYTLNLIDCFKYFQKIDFFTGQNQIFCNKCQTMQDANYCNSLYNVPTILCLVLNRGKDNLDFRENINFGTKLDLTDFVQDKNDLAIYYLIGVVVHVGDSSMSGHFFAYCRSHFTSPWYKYNDAIVSTINENEIYSVGTPYILFYHKYQ